MGLGDFNLTAFYRAMGIKNPEPSMREFVQPVIVVGDLSEVTPQYRPPTGMWGGDVAAFAAEFSFIEVISRADGGSLVQLKSADQCVFRTGLEIVGPTFFDDPHALGCQLSVGPPVSLVRTGHTATAPALQNRSPNTTDQNETTPGNAKLMWIRPGTNIVFWRVVTNDAINDWALTVIDLPASENSIL